jgi:cysteine synthase
LSGPPRHFQDAAECSAANEGVIVPVISVPQDFNEEELYVDLRSIFGHSLFLKCEGFNFAGSIKLKAATEMVEAASKTDS